MKSATEAEFGGFFDNRQKSANNCTSLAEMGHPQPPMPELTDNTEANNIMNGTEKQEISRAIDMRFYWVRNKMRQNNFQIFWEEENKNLADYVTNHHLIWHHRNIQPRYLKPTKNTWKTHNTR